MSSANPILKTINNSINKMAPLDEDVAKLVGVINSIGGSGSFDNIFKAYVNTHKDDPSAYLLAWIKKSVDAKAVVMEKGIFYVASAYAKRNPPAALRTSGATRDTMNFGDIKQKRWRRFSEVLQNKQIEDRGGIQIVCDGKKSYAHRLILEANSPYFYTTLNDVVEDNDSNRLVFEDMKPSVLENVLDFMYTKKVQNIETELHFKYILIASHLLDLNELFQACSDAILSSVSLEMLTELVDKNELNNYQNRHLTLSIFRFWFDNARELICGKDVLFLTFGQARDLLHSLSSHLLCLDCMLGALRWLRHEPEKRAKYGVPLLARVDAKLAKERWIVSLFKSQEQRLSGENSAKKEATCSMISRADDYVIVKNPYAESEDLGMTNRLIFFGPYQKTRASKSDQNSKKVSVVENPLCIQQLCLATMEWLPCEKLNFGCYGDALCQYGQCLYIVGRTHFAIYDVKKNQFTLNECTKFKDRQCGAMCVFKDNMYIVGGCVNEHQTTSVYYAKLGTTDWQEGSPLKCSVSDAIMLTSTNFVYVIVYDCYTYKNSIQFNSSPDKGQPWEIVFVDSNQCLWHTNFFIRDNTLQALYVERNDTVLLSYDHNRKKMDTRRYRGHPRGLAQVMRVCPCVDEQLLQVYLSTRNDSFRIPNFLWNAVTRKWIKLPAPKGNCEMPYSVVSMVYIG